MSTDVGDAVTLTFASLTGATVTVDLYDPEGAQVVTDAAVAESPGGSGRYPYTFTASAAGDWVADFVASGTVTARQTYRTRASDPLAAALTNPPFCTVEEYRARYGGTYTGEAGEQLQELLVDITEEIRSLGGTWIPRAVPRAVVTMVRRVARRELTNPDRKIGETYSAYSYRLADGQLAGEGLLNEAERAEIERLTGRPKGDVALNLVLADNAYSNRAVARRRHSSRPGPGEDWRRR